MQKINQIAILALILAVAMGNRIYPWGEPVLYWPNKGMMTNIQLFFSLNYVLPAGHNLRIRLPFGTNPTYSVTVYQTNTRSIPSTSAIAGTLGLNNPTTFDQYWYFGSDLAAKTNYVLNLQISTAGFPTDSAGWLGFIQLQTLSNANSLNSGSTATDVPIEYDRNLAFAPIHLLAAPNPITWSGTIDSTQISASTTASQSYQLKLSFKLTNDFWYWPTIRLTWSNPAFALTGVVSVDNGTNVTPNPTPLSTSQYSVDYTVPQTITIYHNATILKSYNVIYNVTVQNPNAAASANLGIYVFHRYNLNLTDYATTGVTLSVTNVPNPVVVPVPTVANLTLLLSWGIDPGNSYASPNLLNGVFTIVTSALDPSQRFQAIRFKFDTANIPSGTYTVKAYICASTSNCQVLENSVDSTFGSSAVCGTGSDTTGVYINCTGVSAVASSANIIGARVWISSSLVTTAAINDSVFGSVSVASATVSASTSSINTKIARITQANSLELLANLNGNGPVMADTGSAIWGNFSACTSYNPTQCGSSVDHLNYGGLYGGIFSYTAGGGAAKFALLTTIAHTVDMTASATNGQNVYGTTLTGSSHAVSYDTQDGIDVFLNPNIWTLPSGTVDTTQCWISNIPAAQAIGTALGNASLHCTSKVVSGVYTRLRSITLALPTNSLVDSGSNQQFTYFWGGFVALPAYTGTSLKANSMSDDYYAQLYSVPHASLGLTKPSGNTDIGELGTSGASNLNVSNVVLGQPIFWSQYRIFSVNVPAATYSVTQQFTGLSVWHAGSVYQAGAGSALTSDQVLSIVRVRGALSGSDPISSPPRLALFFNAPSNAYKLIAPAGTYSALIRPTVGRCWSGSASTSTVCTQDRSARSFSAGAISQLEFYQVIATSVSFISSSNTSLAILVKELEHQTALKYRIGFINSNLHYLSAVDATISLTSPSSGTAVLTSGTSPCPISATNNVNLPHVGLTTNSTNIVAQTHDASLHYTATAGITATNGLGSIIWCGQWQFNGTGFTFSGTSALESSTNGDFCHYFDYNSFDDTASNWYCVYCPITTGASTITANSTTAYPSITLKSLTSFYATNVLSSTISQVIDDSGRLVERSACSSIASAFTADTATVAISGGSSFNQTGQKVVFSLTVPSTLWYTKNIILDGRTTAGYASGSSDSSFPRGNFDATAECWITYSVSDPSTWNYFACPTSSSGALTFNVYSAVNGATAQVATSWSIVGWGWNGAQDSTGTPVTQYVYITTQATDSSTTIDQGALASASSLASWNVGVPNQVLSIGASNWNRPILGSRGSFSWQFSSTSVRPLYNGYAQYDVLIFHLDAIITSTINSNTNIIQCRITDNSGSTRNQNFQSCTLSTTSNPTLTIVPWPLGNVATEYSASGVQVNLDGMQAINTPSGFNASIYGSLLFAGQSGLASLTASNVIGGINAPSGLNAALPNILPAPVKVWYGANGNGDILFTLISAQPLNESCRITIEYPTYYNPELVTRFTTPVCYIDGVITHCQTQRHKLYINAFPVSRAANTQFVIRVSGVSGPVFTTADNFWVQINMDDDEDPSNLVYGGQVLEPANNAGSVTNGIHVNWNSVSSLITRSTATFTWTINPLNSENHNTSRAVHIIFPQWWGLAFGSFVPTCKVADYAVPATIYTATQTIIGHNVLLNLTTTLNATQIVNVICDGIRTPENDGTYPFQDIQLRIVSQDGTTTYQKSAPSVHNINWLAAFTHSTGLSYLNWDSSIVSNPSAPISLTRGTYSLLWDVVPNASPRDLTVSVSPAAFQFYPQTFEVLYGDLNSYAYVGCAGGVQMLTYSLLFGVNDSTYWTVPAQQWVAVTNTKVNLVVSPSVSTITFEASSNSTSMSLPISFSTYNHLPYSDVTITPTPVGINSNFSVVPSNVQLTTDAPWGSFVYQTNGNSQATGASETFTYNLTGTNAASYNMPASQTVTTVADTNSYLPATPVLTVSVDPTQLKPTSASLVFTLTGVDTATVYFGCQLAASWTLNANGLVDAALTDFWGLNPYDPQQGQYDLIELTSTATPPQSTQSVSSGNTLVPSTWYECHAVANSLSNRNSTVAVVYFVTPSNGGVRSRWLFNHTTYPNQAQRQALLCTLVQTLAVPVEKIIAVTGEYCSSPSAFYTTDNATGTLAVYFYPLNSNTETVMLPTNLVAQLNTTASFAKLNKTVVAAGGAGINQILADGNPSPTAVSPNFPTSAQTGTSWVSVSPVSLNDTGYVIGVLTTNTTTLAQLAGLSYDLTAPAGGNTSVTVGIQQIQVQYYSPVFGSLSFNFSGLTAANGYNVFLIGSNNDPSIYDNVTAVTQISATTQSPPVTPTSALALISSLMVVIISIISVLFV